MVRDRRTGRGPGLAMMLTVCDKDCDLAARPKANFIIAAVLSSGLTDVSRAAPLVWHLLLGHRCVCWHLHVYWRYRLSLMRHHGAEFRLWRGSIITIYVIPTFLGYQSLRKCRCSWDYYVSPFVVKPFLLVIYKLTPYRHRAAVACARACVLLSARVIFSVATPLILHPASHLHYEFIYGS